MRISDWSSDVCSSDLLGDEAAACAAALVSGQVDGLARCDYSVAESLAGRPGLQVHRIRSAATCLLQMKVDHKPFHHPRVRRALPPPVAVQAVPRPAPRGFGDPGGPPPVAPVPPAYPPL